MTSGSKKIFVRTLEAEKYFDNYEDLRSFVCSDLGVLNNYDKANSETPIKTAFDEAWLTWATNQFVGRYNFYTAKMQILDEKPAFIPKKGGDFWSGMYD